MAEYSSTTLLDRDDPDHLDRLITEDEAARFLGYSVRALQNWRVRGGGPPFVRRGKRSVRYRRRDLIAWAEGLLVASTSEAASAGRAAARDAPSPMPKAEAAPRPPQAAPAQASASPPPAEPPPAKPRRRLGMFR